VPAERPDIFTETLMRFELPWPVEEAEAGLTVNQDFVFVAVQLSVPPPAFQTEKVAEAGFDPPAVALKAFDVALIPIVGVMEIRLRVAETTCGAPTAPGAVRVIPSVWLPAVRPVVLTETTIDSDSPDETLPEVFDKVSHALDLEADQLSVPPPVFLTVKV